MIGNKFYIILFKNVNQNYQVWGVLEDTINMAWIMMYHDALSQSSVLLSLDPTSLRSALLTRLTKCAGLNLLFLGQVNESVVVGMRVNLTKQHICTGHYWAF